MVSGQGDDRPHADPGGVHLQQDEGDPLLRLAFPLGAHQAEHAVGEVGVGGPDLRARQDVVVPVPHRRQLQSRQVRPGPGLGIALAPVVLTGQNPRQEEGFLLRAAVAHDHRPHHPQPHGRQARRPGPGAFGGEDVALHVAPAGPAVLRRPARRDPAPGMQDLLPGEAVVLLHEHAGRPPPGLAQFGGQVGVQEGAHLVAEGEILGGEVEVHGTARPIRA